MKRSENIFVHCTVRNKNLNSIKGIKMTVITPDQIKQALDAANQAIDIYERVVDKIIPWEQYNNTLQEIERYKDDYSEKSADLVGKTKTLLLNAQDAYFNSTQSLYQWCGVTQKLVPIFIDKLNGTDAEQLATAKIILIKVLGEGIQKMDDSISALEASSSSFNEMKGELSKLDFQLTADSSEKSAYFEAQVSKLRAQAYGGAAAGLVAGPFGLIISYSIAAGILENELIPKLKERLESVKAYFVALHDKVQSSSKDIDDAKLQLKQEIQVISDLKIEAISTASLVDIAEYVKSEITAAAGALAQKCHEYQVRHGKSSA